MKEVPFLHLAEVLAEINDLELTLLKSHLLVEEAITDAIAMKADYPKYIFEARLTFSNKTNLVRAFFNDSCEPWVWKSLSLLNKVRNRLAHDLTSEEVELGIEGFVSHVRLTQPMWSSDLLKVKHSDFFWAVFLVLKEIRELSHIDKNA